MTFTNEQQPIVTELTDSMYSGDMGIPKLLQGTDYWVKFLQDEFNRRANVLEFGGDLRKMTFALFNWCRQKNLSKVILKAKDYEWEGFLSLGFVLEGIAKNYFHGREHAFFMAKFLDPLRRYSEQLEKEDQIIESVVFADQVSSSSLPKEYVVNSAREEDTSELAKMYNHVFDTYPTPLNDPEYVNTLLETGTIIKVVRYRGRIVSGASAFIDGANRNAEITDCATRPEHRGKGLMSHLMYALEEDLFKKQVYCLFGMARSLSHGMNLLFKRHGYGFHGRLVNHCNIMGKFEDVNLWVKRR